MDILNLLKKFTLKFTLACVVALVTGIFNTFVMQKLWNWFVAPTFNINAISYWQMYGVYLLARYLLEQGKNYTDDSREKMTLSLLKACVPFEKLEDARDMITKISNETKHNAVIQIVLEIIVGAVVLGVGWCVHTFLL